MKVYLQKLISGESLTEQEAYTAIRQIGMSEVNHSQTAAFLMGIQQKGITVDELLGFREGMLSLAHHVNLDEFDPMDIVGTGGDGKNTFNISTTSAFVVAGAGQAVVKHGNHGVSSAVGASTVLEHLGVHLTADESKLKRLVEASHICLLHAPLFHPAMRFAGVIRKELGIKTLFNVLGPLLNPAQVKKLMTGVYAEPFVEIYQGVLTKTATHFAILYSHDVYDEISLTGSYLLATKEGIQTCTPAGCGFDTITPEALWGGDTAEESARILVSVLENRCTPAQRQVVLANAGTALATVRGCSLAEGVAAAAESLDSGAALRSLKNLVETSQK